METSVETPLGLVYIYYLQPPPFFLVDNAERYKSSGPRKRIPIKQDYGYSDYEARIRDLVDNAGITYENHRLQK
jgi:hypothetical protein